MAKSLAKSTTKKSRGNSFDSSHLATNGNVNGSTKEQEQIIAQLLQEITFLRELVCQRDDELVMKEQETSALEHTAELNYKRMREMLGNCGSKTKQETFDQFLQTFTEFRDELESKEQEICAFRSITEINQRKMKELFDEIDSKAKQVTLLEDDVTKSKSESEFLKKALAGEQDLHRVYKEEIERSTESDPMKKAEIHALRERTMTLYEELNKMKKEKKALRDQIDSNIEIELELNCVESKLDASVRENSRLSEKLNTVNKENKDLQERITALYKQQQDLKEEMRFFQSSNKGGVQRQWLINAEEIKITDEMLGSGAFGKVHVAVFRGTKMAAKTLHSILLSPYNRDKFNREISLSATAHHPNIVQFIGAVDLANPILLYELMDTSLYSYLQKGQPLTHSQITEAGCDIAAALCYLHQHKPHPIIHRDVCSPNVLMDPLPNGRWKHKLSDLGAASLQCCTGKNSVFPGNPFYAAPEAENPEAHTPAMDVHSFGVMLMEITLDRAPEGTRESRAEQWRSIEWEPIKELVQLCLSEDYMKRPCISYVLKTLESL